MRTGLLPLLLALVACSDGNVSQPEGPGDDVRLLLESLPDWHQTFIGYADAAVFAQPEFEAYEDVARALSRYALDEIEAGFDAAVRAEPGPLGDMRGNGHVLLRILFVVPAEIPLDDFRVPNPYIGSTLVDGIPDPFPLAWPVTMSPDGVVLDIRPMPGVNGTGHAVLDEYRWFASTFERRGWAP